MTPRLSKTLLVALTAIVAVGCGQPTEQKAPEFTSTPVTSAVAGIAYSYSVEITGRPAPTITGALLPEWLSLENGKLSGTPGASDVGDHEVSLTASNGVSPNAVQTFTIKVAADSTAPTFTSEPVTGATADQPYVYTVAVSGTPTPTITATQIPEWMTLETNVLSGTPGSQHRGNHTVVLTASNGVDPDAVQTFTVTVANSSDAPAFTSTAITTATEGQPYSYTVTTSGTPAPTVKATTLPTWLTFDTATKTLSGTPAYLDGGEHQVVLTASNGKQPDAMQSFKITVTTTSVGVAPLFTSTPVTTATEGVAYAYTVTTSGFPDVTVTAATLPKWLTFEGGVLLGQPAYADGGPHRVVLMASNGVSPTATQTFDITVTTVSTAPAFTSTPDLTAQEDSTYSYTVVTSGVPAPILSVTGAGGTPLPSWLSFNPATRVLSGTPRANDVGSHSVVITASNGIPPAAQQTFTIDVASVPKPPTLISTTFNAAIEGQVWTYSLYALGNPAPTFSATLPGGAALPAWISFDPATGVFSGTPGPADVGPLQVEVTASNGLLPNHTRTFNLIVASASITITSTAPATGQAGVPYSYTITTDAYPPAVVTVKGQPGWLGGAGTDTLSGIPRVGGTTGNITVTATNGLSVTGTQTFNITIAPPAPLPLAGNPAIEKFNDSLLPVGWSETGNVWAVGVPTIGTDSVGPPTVLDGPVVATNPTGNYVNSMNAQLQTRTYDLTGVTNAVLKFDHWYNFENIGTSYYDGANIKISTDAGATWSTLLPSSVVPAYPATVTSSSNVLHNQPAWVGLASGWQAVVVDLEANLGGLPRNQVKLRFDAGSEGSGVRPGWYIDNVKIGAAADL